MAKYKLSIIVPVYNVEQYLEECINSILAQEPEACQIILVDDGSTDNSGLICDRYLHKPQFKVIHKDNGGPSSARNAGMKAAEGEYIAFLDSDDRLASGSLSAIVEWIDSCATDICMMEAVCFFPDGRTVGMGDMVERKSIKGRPKEEVFEHLATRPKYPGSACTKLFKRSFLEGNKIQFPNDKRLSEDLIFCLRCFLCAETYDALSFPYYEYRKDRNSSRSSSVSLKSFNGMASFVEDAVTICTRQGKPLNQICEYALSFAAYEYSIMLWQYARLRGENRNKAGEILHKYRWLLSYGRSGKTRLVNAVSKALGLSISARILDMYMRNR